MCRPKRAFYSAGQPKTPLGPLECSPEFAENFLEYCSFPFLQTRGLAVRPTARLRVFALGSWDMAIFRKTNTGFSGPSSGKQDPPEKTGWFRHKNKLGS